jgi:hypothetical protein
LLKSFIGKSVAQKHGKRGPEAALSGFLLLYLLYQVEWGKPAEIRSLFLLANVRVGGNRGGLGG